MVKYSRDAENSTKSCKASGSDLRVHFKNTCVTADAIRHMPLKKAKKYLEDVLEKKQAIPFRYFNGCVGRHAQAKMTGATQCRWPKKSCEFLLHLLKNAESNAEVKGLDTEAEKVVRVFAAPAEECGEQCGGEGAGHGGARDLPHPGQPRPKAAEAHLPRARPHQPVHVVAVPHRAHPSREGARGDQGGGRRRRQAKEAHQEAAGPDALPRRRLSALRGAVGGEQTPRQ
mmetsp:Transcript_32687/g.104140  ORF Transcript_32687/g.104140 Transcript_32687/m.104140 type:complete len:229 (+) Transcript_32687:75-761(+)